MKIEFVKNISPDPKKFHHLFRVNLNQRAYYFLIVGNYTSDPFLDEEDETYLSFDSIEDSDVEVYCCDEEGWLMGEHPGYTLYKTQNECLQYCEVWEYLVKYCKNFYINKTPENVFKSQIMSFLENRIKEIGRPATKISDNKDMDIYNLGTLDAYRNLLVQIKNDILVGQR